MGAYDAKEEPAAGTNVCKWCSSKEVVRKGRTAYGAQLYKCKSCGRKFVAGSKRRFEVNWKAVKGYLFDYNSLEAFIRSEELRISKSTLNGKMVEFMRKAPSGLALSIERRRVFENDTVLGVDSTELHAGRKKSILLYCHAAPSGEPLAYEIVGEENEQIMKEFLRKVRDVVGFQPRLVVCDLRNVRVAKSIFPEAIVQACLFHLVYDLNKKKLPTKRLEKQIEKLEEKKHLTEKQRIEIGEKRRRLKGRCDAKKRIMIVAMAQSRQCRELALRHLEEIESADERVRKAVNEFRDSLEYYHTTEEFIEAGVVDLPEGVHTEEDLAKLRRVLYDNVSESHVGLIKELSTRMRGFKKPESISDYVNSYYYIWRTDETVRHKTNPSKQHLFKELFTGDEDYKMLSRLTGLDAKLLEQFAPDRLQQGARAPERLPSQSNSKEEEKTFTELIDELLMRNGEMHYRHLTEEIVKVRTAGKTPDKTVLSILSRGGKKYRKLGKGIYCLASSSVKSLGSPSNSYTSKPSPSESDDEAGRFPGWQHSLPGP